MVSFGRFWQFSAEQNFRPTQPIGGTAGPPGPDDLANLGLSKFRSAVKKSTLGMRNRTRGPEPNLVEGPPACAKWVVRSAKYVIVECQVCVNIEICTREDVRQAHISLF